MTYTRTFKCMCEEDHEIAVQRVSDELPMLYICDESRVYNSWKDRLKAALKILLYGQCVYTEIVLDQGSASQLAEAILATSGFTLQYETSIPPATLQEAQAMFGTRRCD